MLSQMAYGWIMNIIVKKFNLIMSVIHGLKSLFLMKRWNWYDNNQETSYYEISSFEKPLHTANFHFPQKGHYFSNFHNNCPCHVNNKRHKIYHHLMNRWRRKKLRNFKVKKFPNFKKYHHPISDIF